MISTLPAGYQKTSLFHWCVAISIGIVAIYMGGFHVAWMVLAAGFVVSLCVIPVLVYSRINLPFFYLCVYVLLLPADISKAFKFDFIGEESIKYFFLQDIVFFFLLISWIIELTYRKGKTKAHFSFIIIPFSIFVFWSELTAFNAIKPHLTFLHITTYLKWFLIFLCISSVINTKKRMSIILMCLMATSVLQGGYVLAQLKFKAMLAIGGQKATELGRSLTFGSATQKLLRPSGTFHHPNVLASYMVYILPIFFSLILTHKKKFFKAPLYLSFGAGFFALLLSYSRGGWIGFLAAAMIILVLAAQKRMIQPKTVFSIFLLAGILAGIMFPFWQPFVARLTRPDDSSSATRVMMLKQAYLMVKKHPFMGIGLGNYAESGKDFIPDHSSLIRAAPKGYVAHNRYAVIIAETGLIGLALYLWLLSCVYLTAQKNLKIKDEYMLHVSLGLYAGLMGIFICMMFDHFSDNTRNTLFWFYASLIYAVMYHFGPPKVPKAQFLSSSKAGHHAL